MRYFVLFPTLPIRTLHHYVLELHGHREAGVDLEAEGGGAGVGGVGLRVDIALCPRLAAAGHVNLEGIRLAQLDLQLRLAQEDTRVHDARPHHLEREVKILILRLGVERQAGLLFIVDPDNRAIPDRPTTRIPGGPPACERTAIEEVAVYRRRLRLHGRGDLSVK